MEFVCRVESRGRCLFCQRKEEIGIKIKEQVEDSEEFERGEEEDYDSFVEYSLRQICHYLRVNLNKDVLVFRSGGKQNIPKDFSVLLCQDCYVVADKLTNLCKELERIQMLANNSFGELIKIISTGSEPLGEDQDEDMTKVVVANLLRERIRQLSASTLKRSRQAVVKINKFEVETDENEANNDFPSYHRITSPVPTTTSDHHPVESPKLEQHQQNSPRDGDAMNCDDSDSEELDPNRAQAQPCPFCNESPKLLKYHMVTSHPEQFFSTSKISEISEEKFHIATMRLMRQESKLRIPNNLFKCAHCDYTAKDRRRLMSHLIDFHYEILSKKLEEYQVQAPENEYDDGDKTLNEGSVIEDDKIHSSVYQMLIDLPNKQLRKENKIVYSCDLCALTEATIVPDHKSLEEHVFDAHPEHFFMPLRKPNVPQEHFKLYCQKLFKSVQLDQNVAGSHLVKYCQICTVMFHETSFLTRHQIQSHYVALCGKLSDLMEKEGVEVEKIDGINNYNCNYCGATFHNKGALGGHTKNCQNRSLSNVGGVDPSLAKPKCHHCGMEFGLRGNLVRHLKHSCEKLKRLRVLPPGISKSSFERAMASSSRTPTPDPSSSRAESSRLSPIGNEHARCQVCPLKFPDIFALGRHTKQKHPQYQQQLPSSIGTPIIGPRGAMSSGPRRKCPHCDMIFVNSGNLNRHLKNSCEGLKKLGLLKPPQRNVTRVKCLGCDRTFIDSKMLKKHLKLGRCPNTKEQRASNDNQVEVEVDFQQNTMTLHGDVPVVSLLEEDDHDEMDADSGEVPKIANVSSLANFEDDGQDEDAFDVDESINYYNGLNDNEFVDEDDGEQGVGAMIMGCEDPLQM